MNIAKYSANTIPESITEAGVFVANGCHGYTLFNQGNVNITLWNDFVLRPGQYIGSPEINPEIVYNNSIPVVYDITNAPVVVQPDTGPAPALKSITPGDPPPARDTRLVCLRHYLIINKE